MNQDKLSIAAFDFDGTLTYHDTLFHFLLFSQGKLSALSKLFLEVPNLALYAMGKIARQQAKEGVLTRFFAGQPMEKIRRIGQEFASAQLQKHLKPEAMRKLKWHQQQGHKCVLISASVDVYLDPWAKQAGIDHVICSQMAQAPNGLATGKLQGLNCWGPEKSRRLTEYLGDRSNYNIYAYGDSRGDKELLEMADYPFYRTFERV